MCVLDADSTQKALVCKAGQRLFEDANRTATHIHSIYMLLTRFSVHTQVYKKLIQRGLLHFWSFLFVLYVFNKFLSQYHAYINFGSLLLQIHFESRFWSQNSVQMPIFGYFTKGMDSNILHGWSFTWSEPPSTPSKVDSTKTIPLSRGWVVGNTFYLYLQH